MAPSEGDWSQSLLHGNLPTPQIELLPEGVMILCILSGNLILGFAVDNFSLTMKTWARV